MAEIKVDELVKHVDSLKDWLKEGHSLARECIVIKFKRGVSDSVIDEEMVNKTLYFQSRDGNVAIEFDKSGLISYIEIS